MTKLQVKLKLSNCLIVFQIGFLPFYLDFIKFLPPTFQPFLPVSSSFYLSTIKFSTRFHQVNGGRLQQVNGGRLQPTNLWTDIQRPSQNDTKTLQGSPGIPGAKRHEIVSNFLEPPRFPQPCLRQKCVRP